MSTYKNPDEDRDFGLLSLSVALAVAVQSVAEGEKPKEEIVFPISEDPMSMVPRGVINANRKR